MLAATLVTTRTSLPPEGAGLAWDGPALAAVAPTLVTTRNSSNGWLRKGAATDADWQSQIRVSRINNQAFTRYLQ